ncbi:MAG: MGMT family protein [Vicingaceae bacterium]
MVNNDFFLRVYDIVRLIPKGKVTTYGHIARALGTGRSARMVGWAMNASHKHDPLIPAHRVVNRKGLLTGKMHFDNPNQMEELLKSEGLVITDNAIKDLEQFIWDPSELGDDL